MKTERVGAGKSARRGVLYRGRVSRFAASVRGFWRAFRKGPGRRVEHSGHDLARTAKDANTIGHSRGGGGFSGTSAVDRHVVSGASDYAKSFEKDE